VPVRRFKALLAHSFPIIGNEGDRAAEALSELRILAPREGFAADEDLGGAPPPAGCLTCQFPLHHFERGHAVRANWLV